MATLTQPKQELLMMYLEDGAVHVSYAEAGQCKTCHAMHHFFVQRKDGPSQCIYCDTDTVNHQHQEARYESNGHSTSAGTGRGLVEV